MVSEGAIGAENGPTWCFPVPAQNVSELRNWRVSPVRNNRQIVHVRVRYWYVDEKDRATGSPMTYYPKFTCERRRGQWRIFSEES